MKVVYNDDIAMVYHGDMREGLPPHDYIITDPPYNIGFKYPDYKDSLNEDEYIALLSTMKHSKTIMIHYSEAFCGVISHAMGPPKKCVPWCYSSNLKRQHRMIAWFNTEPNFELVRQPYKNMNDKRIIRLIEQGSQGARLYDWWDDIQLVKNVSKEKHSEFTNQIPIPLLERILLITTKEGDTILDPFFGSGSLYFACKNTGRKCIGIEQSLDHIQIFKERLAKYKELI